eukprot:TRINITY_DN6111_c0_g2_i1.p1 TRINITY_DN6111_c0_g2~~TRINITY_DN6111_c0_g2_i1.p1  ORF type:complete len:1009 (+),score=233.61 TRINITY_DN6111_c0_g2_i1:350-3376(+)
MAEFVRRRTNLPAESDDGYEDSEYYPDDDPTPRGSTPGRRPIGPGPQRRPRPQAPGNRPYEADLYASDYPETPSGTDGPSRSSTMDRSTTLGRSPYSRQNSFFNRQFSLLSSSSTLPNMMYDRTATLGKTLNRMLTGRYDFETEEEVEEAAVHLEQARRVRLEEGEGGLERVATQMIKRTETLARTLTMPLEMARSYTMQKIRDIKDVIESEEVQAKIQAAKVKVMYASTGRPSWHPEPQKVPIPSACNLCTFFIIALALCFPGLFFWGTTRDYVMKYTVEKGLLAETAGPALPSTALPSLGDVCSSGGYAAQAVRPGSQAMTSTWWSTNLGNGAQIQLQSLSGSSWWSPYTASSPKRRLLQTGVVTGTTTTTNGTAAPPPPASSINFTLYKAWGQGALGLFTTVTPPATTFITVARLNATYFYLMAPNGKYIAVTSAGTLEATSSNKTAQGLFSANVLSSYAIQLQTLSGGVVGWGGAAGQGLPLKVYSSESDASSKLGNAQSGATYTSWNVREVMQVASIRGVNLGGWLMVEEWMSPSLYTGVPDLIDGWQVQFLSVAYKSYVTTWQNNYQVHCNANSATKWETWHIRRTATGGYQFRNQPNGQYLHVDFGGTEVWATSASVSTDGYDSFILHVSTFNDAEVMVQLPSGPYLKANADGSLSADGEPGDLALAASWGGATTFKLVRVTAAQGEWQVSAWAPSGAATLAAHRASYIVESDWAYMAALGVNTVRIPVGYWATQMGTPDSPYVAGSLDKLDWAFSMAVKYNIRIWLSMHGAPGSQNRGHECGTRDGIIDWGSPGTPYVQETVNAVAWLAERYGKSKALFGFGVLNEPNVDGPASVSDLMNYHLQAYKAIRTYSPCCYVGISGFIGGSDSDFDGFMTDPLLYNNVVYDVHLYTVFDSGTFGSLSAKQIGQYVNHTWGGDLSVLTQGGRTVLVGEWSLGLPSTAGSSFSDINSFGLQELETFNNASAGWFFWSLREEEGSTGVPNWSLEAAFAKGWLHYASS